MYTSGKGSSAAGLTASVIRDANTGEFYLEVRNICILRYSSVRLKALHSTNPRMLGVSPVLKLERQLRRLCHCAAGGAVVLADNGLVCSTQASKEEGMANELI